MFISRLISWLVLVALFSIAILFRQTGNYILAGLFIFGAFMSVYEIIAMLERIYGRGFKKTAAVFAAITMVSVTFGGETFSIIPLLFLVLWFWVLLLGSGRKEELVGKAMVSFSGIIFGLLPIYFLCRIFYFHVAANPGEGAEMLLYLVAVTKTGDTFAYITGMLSNKILKGKNHKIVPNISPKKSWEGTIGGMIFAIIASTVLYYLLFAGNSCLFPLIMGTVLFWGGFFGDLSESALKRTCGVKDSGKILPGMGGVNDLLDSFIFNAPLFYFYLLLAC
ncbi:MAG: phosphatidate cytidylyltransferase [Victivallales bacterium]|nr:phosphatidate cytidylyltransferase [Victivallales bacterium]